MNSVPLHISSSVNTQPDVLVHSGETTDVWFLALFRGVFNSFNNRHTGVSTRRKCPLPGIDRKPVVQLSIMGLRYVNPRDTTEAVLCCSKTR